MEYLERVLVKNVEGFNIYFEAHIEYDSLENMFPNDSPEQIDEMYRNSVIFCARVTAEKAGVELANDYLGGCVYGSYEDFYNDEGCYMDDMVRTVVEAAKKELPNIVEQLTV